MGWGASEPDEEGACLTEFLGLLLWGAANYLYVDFRRTGRKGMVRFLLFWSGAPMTWLWLFTVEEGEAPPPLEPMDDEDALLQEIRRERERELRPGGAQGPGGAP